MTTELKKFLDIATIAALEGGSILKKYMGNLRQIREKERSGDLVTEADHESEATILAIIKRHYPEHQILAEESGLQGTAHNDSYLWAIDPLDGTVNYAHGYTACGVSIALLKDGVPIVGVIYNPFRDELFRAAQGLGATCNYQPIQVSKTATLEKSLLVTGFAYDRRETTDNNYAEFCHLTHLTQGVRRGGSASVDLADMACGRLDGYWERGLSPWDLAAGVVIVLEAGGTITAYDQSPFDLFSGRILCTNGLLHQALSEALLQTPPLNFAP